MINGILGQGPIQVLDNANSNIHIDLTRSFAGTVRYNGNIYALEVYDGYQWLAINNNYATISLDNDSLDVINWAKQKMALEKERETLAANHPAVASALTNFKRTEEQLEIIINLSKNHDTAPTS